MATIGQHTLGVHFVGVEWFSNPIQILRTIVGISYHTSIDIQLGWFIVGLLLVFI
jgi:hypothetical protein